jgi:hypothetical protein
MELSASTLSEAVSAFLQADHGSKSAVAQRFALAWQCSPQTVYRRVASELKQLTGRGRKRRSDAGESAWTMTELETVAAFLLESRRQNDKQLADLDSALDTLRANGLIRGEALDAASGEIRLLGASSCAKALRHHRLHPDQLTAPTPKVELASEHPNHVWQCDPSLCVLYYLRGDEGVHVMPNVEFNKNKPKNLDRIASDRVWRYVITDHASGAIYVEYVLGAESGENLCQTFINATQQRSLADPFYGVPRMVMVDPGSANTGAMFRNLCAAFGTKVWINLPGQPWAKGQVEKSNDIVERKFEFRVRFKRPKNLAELNDAAWRWMRHFNATAMHTRHRSSRYQAWMTITPEQLRIAPSKQECLRLATHAPEQRQVSSLLRISFRGKTFDVSGVPGVIVGQGITVTRHAFGHEDDAQVLHLDDDGRETWFTMAPLERNAFGFTGAAVPVGEYHSHADTPVDTNRKRVQRLVMGAATDAEATAKRKAKVAPFGGAIDPYKSINEAPEISHLPRRGLQLDVVVPDVQAAPQARDKPFERPQYTARTLGHVELAQLLRQRVANWNGEHFTALVQGWPDGATEADVDAIAQRLLSSHLVRRVS